MYHKLFKLHKESFQERPYYCLWADIIEIGRKGTLISIQNLNSFTDKTIIVPREDYTKIFHLWNPLALYSQTYVQRNSLKMNPNYKSSWGKVKWNEISLVLFQSFTQQVLTGHLLCEQHGARCSGLQWWTNRNTLLHPRLLRAASDRVKVSLILSHDRSCLCNPAGCWHPKGHSRDHLGNWDKNRERAGLNGFSSSRTNCFQITVHFAYQRETTKILKCEITFQNQRRNNWLDLS